MITIIDYGLGNLASVKNMFKKVGVKTIVTSDLEKIKKSTKILLPGVGSFDAGMSNLEKTGIKQILLQKAKDGVPILGICLGMQLLTKSSKEGSLRGLGLLDATVMKFENGLNVKIPHMGWNYIKKSKINKFGLEDNDRFYFVHSFYVNCENIEDVMVTTSYGNREFVSGFSKGKKNVDSESC